MELVKGKTIKFYAQVSVRKNEAELYYYIDANMLTGLQAGYSTTCTHNHRYQLVPTTHAREHATNL